MASFEMNKFAAAVLLAGIIAMVIGIAGDMLVKPHGLAKQAYIVEGVEAAGAAPAAAQPQATEPIAPLLASANAQRGETVAKVCSACHSFGKGEAARVGPNLYGIVGAHHAHQQGYSYSQAMAGMKDETWSYEKLNEFLAKPQQVVKGTKMTFAGVGKTQDRADLIAYLRTLSDAPQPLP
jgi:cytochrome c